MSLTLLVIVFVLFEDDYRLYQCLPQPQYSRGEWNYVYSAESTETLHK